MFLSHIYTGAGLNAPASNLLRIPTDNGTITSLYVDMPSNTSGDALFEVFEDGVSVGTITVTSGSSNATTSGLSYAMTKGKVLSLSLIAPLPGTLPDPPFSLIVYYTPTALEDTASTTEVLTGTATNKLATPDAIAALWEQGSDVASATTVTLGEGGYFNITGTTTITDIDFGTTKAGRTVKVKFAGILTLTHHATNLILPTGANITTAAGDVAEFVSEGGDIVRCTNYQRADGTALAGSGGGVSDGDKGDITVSGSGATWTVDNDVVTFAKMQNIATDSLVGRDTASSGDPENILLNATLEMDGAGNLRRAALTGDVTASAGSNATTIANNAVTTAKILDDNVTLAKIANAAANSKLLGSGDAGSGANYVEITLGTGLSMSGTTLNASGSGSVATDTIFDAKGDLPVGTGADTAAKLSVGTNGQVLTADSAQSTGVKWATFAGGGDALVANPLSQFAATTSAQLRGVLSDETGTGAAVFADTPTLVTPILGTPTSGTLTNCTGLPVAGITPSTSTALGVGSLELGHASDTTLARASAGEVTVEGTPILKAGKQSFYVPSGILRSAVTNGPSIAQIESATNKINYYVWDFDGTTSESVHFNRMMPKDWDKGTITFQIAWETTNTGTAGVAWGVQAVALSDGDTKDAAYGTAVYVVDNGQSSAAKQYTTAESAAVTIAGSPANDDLIHFRILRDPTNGSDNMSEDARLIGVKIFYTTNASNEN